MSGLDYTVRHTATAYSNAVSVIFQGVTSAACPITINRIELQSAVTTSSQAVVVIQWGIYTGAAHAAGTPVTPKALAPKNTLSSATAWRIASATLGTTFAVYKEWQWNIALPFDHVLGMPSLKIEVPAATVWALVLPAAAGTPTFSGSVDYTEY